MFEKILVAVDDSEDSLKAFDYAVDLASRLGSKIAVATIFEINRLNVYEYLQPENLRQKKEKVVNISEDYMKKAEKAGITVEKAYVDEGDPAHVIVEEIIPIFQPDLLVCGASKKKSFIRSEANEMAHMAECSVLIVK